jgi:DnaJ like chaperone protein
MGVSYWGKLVGGVAGLFVGGPPGAVMGAALGHAVDSGAIPNLRNLGFGPDGLLRNGLFNAAKFHPARIAAMMAPREQLFAMSVVALSAKLAKCDGPVSRAEIDAFKRHFRVPPENARDVGRLFDQARDSPDDFEPYARQLGDSFADSRGVLEDVLAGLFGIARADGEPNQTELDFLARTARGFGLHGSAWDRARGGASRAAPGSSEPDPYTILGVARTAPDEAVRAAWKQLMRENHPDGLAAKGVPPEFVARATAKVATINAAWDRVKRERGL